MAEATIKDVKKNTVVFLRHGESEWIHKNIYCGWYDSDITREGEREAEKAGQILKEDGYVFDEVYTSVLRRAGKTVNILLDILKQPDIPVYKSWRLNSRHYGALTGLSKGESIRKYGEERIKLWRRAYDIPPPEITKDNPYYNRILEDPIYKGGPSEEDFPITESLQQAIERTLPYFNDIIAPRVANGKHILIVGHMNSLRAIIKAIDRISDEKIMEYNIPTGVPFIYELTVDLKPIISLKFLGDADYVRKANETLTTPGRGFERPKRSKPSVLEVYDYLSKKTEPVLPAVQSVKEHNVAGIRETKEPQIVETKLDTMEIKAKEEIEKKIEEQKLEEIVEPKIDQLVHPKADKLVEPEQDKLLEKRTDVVEPKAGKMGELKVDIVEPKLDKLVEPRENEIKAKQLEPNVENLIDLYAEVKETVVPIETIVDQLNDGTEKEGIQLEPSSLDARDKIHGRDDAIAKQPESVQSHMETDNMHTKEDVISGIISIIHDDSKKIDYKSKPIGTSISITSKDYEEGQEILSTKRSVAGNFQEIEEKLSMVTSRMAPSQVLMIEKEAKEKTPTKKEEKIEIEKKSRAQL